MEYDCKNQKGFSLIELMVVVAIIGIMASLAYVGMEFIEKERVKSATRQLLADIQKARVDSLTSTPASDAIQGHGIRFSAGSYTIFTFDEDELSTKDFNYSGQTEESNPRDVSLSASLALSWSDPNDAIVLIYNRFGFPKRYKSDGSDSFTLSANAMDISITSTGSDLTKCIKVTENSIREGAASGTDCIEQ